MVNKVLSELEKWEKGKVLRGEGKTDIRRRIMDMGVVRGALVEVERIAPLGDPIEIRVKGYHLSLRKEEAKGIQVEVIE